MSNLNKPNRPSKPKAKEPPAKPASPKIELVRIIPKTPPEAPPPDPAPEPQPGETPQKTARSRPGKAAPPAKEETIPQQQEDSPGPTDPEPQPVETLQKNPPRSGKSGTAVAKVEEQLPSGTEAPIESSQAEKEPEKGAQETPPPKVQVPKPPCLQPISPATEPMQYRAIGLVQGRFVPEEIEENKGTLITADGSVITAVILGKMMAIVKKRLDIAREYLWVVYPRTQPETAHLHLQITGVWAPLELSKPDQPLDPGIEEGRFSVRGEVVQISQETNTIVVKIKRSDAKAQTKQALRKFKLQIKGTLPEDAVGYFWEIVAVREGMNLRLVEGTSIGLVPKKPFTKKRGGGRPRSKGEGRPEGARPEGARRPPGKSEKPQRPAPSTARPQKARSS